MKRRQSLIKGVSALTFAAFFFVLLLAPAKTYPPFLKKAQAMGMPATDCTFCHTQAQGGEGWNDRGQWLIAEKKNRSVDRVDVAWLADYKPGDAKAHTGAEGGGAAAAAATAPAAAAAAATNTITPAADVPTIGSAAPEFSLTTNEGKTASLKDFKGKWVVLYFYPKDFTAGCTLEAKNFQRDLAKYEQNGAVILGVSVDTAESHQSFCAKEGLSFKLLSDPDAKTSTQYGSVMERQGTKLSARNTFIIDPQGKIAKVFTGVKPAGHSEELLIALSELQKK